MTRPFGNRFTLVLLVLCALLGWAIQQRLQPVGEVAFKPAQPMPKAGPGVALSEPPSAPPLSYYDEIKLRPLFTPGRTPPEDAALSLETVAVSLPFVLGGIIITPDQRAVLLQGRLDKETVRLVEGESRDGWTLLEVTPVEARFGRGNQETRLLLKPESSVLVAPGVFAQGLTNN